MYTIISGTNRKDSNTRVIADHYREVLTARGIEAQFISLEGLYVQERSPEWVKLETDILIPTRRFIILSPEYNGSNPGVLKCFIDISDIKKVWWGKQALLTGISTGRAGNLRGLEDLTGILHYLKVHVHPNKLPISVVDKLVDAEGNITDQYTLDVINTQVDEFINF